MFYSLYRQFALRRRFSRVDTRLREVQRRWTSRTQPSLRHTQRLSELCPSLPARIVPERAEDQYVALSLIDRNGRHLPLVEPFWTTRTISPAEFRPGYRHSLVVVEFDGNVGVLKNFRGNVAEFVNEVETALNLQDADCNVPDVLHVDFNRLYVVYGYIGGTNLRVAFEEAGLSPRLLPIPHGLFVSRRKWERHLSATKHLVNHLVDEATIDRIWQGLNAIHRAGYALEDIKWGNIILKERTNAPIFLDFERALNLKGLPQRLVQYLQMRDERKLAWILGAQSSRVR